MLQEPRSLLVTNKNMEKLKIKIEESVDQVSLLENISYYILLVTAFLIPLFFIPSSAFQFQFSKAVFISLAVLLSFALWILARLKDGRYLIPNNVVFVSAGTVLIVTLVSAFMSSSVRTSFIGQGFEIGTWANIVVMILMMVLFSALFRPKERVFYLYLALFASALLIVLFHALRFLFGEGFLSFGIFTDITSNLIGKWNDLGIFFGLVGLLSLITLELLQLSRAFKILIGVIFALSIISLAIVNFPTLWYVLAFYSLLYFVYAYAYKPSFARAPENSTDAYSGGSPNADLSIEHPRPVKVMRGSIAAVVLIVLSTVFLIDYYTVERKLSTAIAEKFEISNLEVRPNWSSTLSVASNTIRKEPVFGTGQNRFTNEWVLYKPDGINESIFWNTDFSFGVGILPTQLVTTGILGFLSWLALILSVAYLGLRYLLTPVADKLKRYLSVSSFFASLFLWTFFIFYIPSTSILALTFLFTGVFLASLYNERLLKPKTISFADEPKVSFISVLMLTALLVGAITLAYVFGQKFTASAYFQRALIAVNIEGNIERAEELAMRALSISKNDLYDRFLTEVALGKINTLLSNTSSGESTDAVRARFQTLMGDAIRYARDAADFDATNYQNWVTLGRVYEAVVPLGIEGAYNSAKVAYDEAQKLNPRGPEIRLMQARLALANIDRATAKEKISEARSLKGNYTEAVFLLSQIQADEGDIPEAIVSVESAAVLAPNDPTVFFQLGILKYNSRDYRGAIEALERSMLLAPSYSNAKYFLGLSYEKMGRDSDALTQFRDILTLNPGNAEIPQIIENIEAGRDPFVGADVEERPENRDTLPVEEESPEEE